MLVLTDFFSVELKYIPCIGRLLGFTNGETSGAGRQANSVGELQRSWCFYFGRQYSIAVAVKFTHSSPSA